MEDEGGVLLDGKALGNLRVVDLKQELEKRGLSKSGSKKDLVKRLKQQLEFEKLCGERKSTGDCDLKLELDADTEQNEFVQQYLAQQQKIYAEQKEVKRLIELEEVQKSGDERGSDSPKAEDASDHDTRDTSDNESPPEVFETVQAASSVQKSENKIDVDSSKMDEDDSRQKEIKKKDNDSEKIASPIKGGNVKQTTEAENPLSKIKAEEMPAQSDSNEEIAMTKVSKIEVVGTKNKESSNQIKSVENVGTIDHEVEVEEEDKKVESEDCIADENSEDPSSKNETKSSDQSPDNMETEPKTMVSNILDSFYVQPERKDEELISERSTVHSSEGVEIEPRREVSSPQHPSNEPAIENQNVSEQPSGENISTVLPSSSSVTDKSSENSPDIHVVMEPATEVSPVPYALSENKENVIKPVPKPVHEENVSEVKRTSKTDGYAKDTDSDSESKSPASEKELSEPEETLNFNGKSSRKKLVRGTSQETDNPVKENKLEKSPEKDSAPVRVVDKSQLKNVTRRGKSKTKSRKYSEDSEEGEMKSGSESESGDSSDSSEHRRSRRKSRKGKRKVSRSKSSDSSRSRSRESRSVEKVVKRDNKGNSKANAGSDSKSHDGSKKSKTKTRKGKRNSREVKKRRSRSGSSNSSRSQSRDSSFEKVERTDSEGNSKVDADSVSKSHGDASMQGRSKLETIKSKQHSRVSKRKASRSESSNSSRSQSRGSSVEKVGRRDSEESSKIDASSFSKSHDDSNELEKSKPKTSDSKRGRQNSRKDQRKISRSGSSSSSRSRSRGSSVEKVERRDSKENLKTDSGSFSKSRDDNKQEKSKPETSDSKRGRQDSKKDQRKISRSGSSSSSRSRSRGSSVEKVERRDSKENLKTDSGSFSKSRDDKKEQEKSKPKTSDSKQSRQRKISRSGSSSSSRSGSRGSSVEKVERRDSEENSKIDAGSFSKSRDDNNEQEKSKPKTSDSKRGRQNSRKDQRKISRSGSSSNSRSRSRGGSVEKVERRDSEENSKIDAGSFSKSHDDNNEQEKSKPETSDSKRGRQDSKKGKRKISRSGSSSSSRSRSRDPSVEKVEKMETEENSKASASSVSKSHDDTVEKEEHKPETPQKRLKLKRDNVIVSDLPQATKKDTNEDKTPQKRKDSDAGVDETVEKNNAELTKQIEPQPVKYVSTRKIRISGRKVTEKSEDEPKIKRGKWGSYSSAQKPSKAISISTDSLKNWFPDFKLLKNPDISEAIEEMQVVSKDENNPDHQTEKIDKSKHISQNIEMKDEQISEPVEQIDESEATNILFIQNLVRPFTLLQLKELLKETGNFIEEKFWIDKIKSKCFVTYSTVEEAIKTKTTLNGARWPSSNPKILSVEFSTEEDLQLHQSGSEPPKPLPPPPPVENPEPLEEHSLEDLRRKERDPQERRRDRSKPQPVREWDKNKLTQESPTRERISRSIERSRSSDKKEKKDSKRRPNEDTPAKLLDDLFQKTKSSPCIYWLPLTEEQVVEREEARRLRKLEREKRIQQREQEEAEQKAKAAQSRNRGREMDSRRSSTRSRSPVSRRR